MPEPDPNLDQLLRTAIDRTRLLRLRYRNKDRIVEPHDYGQHNGVIKLLTWQIGGSSSGPLPNWRWMEIDQINCSTRPSQADAPPVPASITNGTNSSSESNRLTATRVEHRHPTYAPLPKTHVGFVMSLAAEQGVEPEAVEKEFFEKARPSSILQRFATPEEIASVVAFVASPLASAINGAAVRADGGVIRSIA